MIYENDKVVGWGELSVLNDLQNSWRMQNSRREESSNHSSPVIFVEVAQLKLNNTMSLELISDDMKNR